MNNISRPFKLKGDLQKTVPPSDEGADCLWQSLSVSLEAPTETAVERWHGFAVTEGEKML